jgi:hypothetical protein
MLGENPLTDIMPLVQNEGFNAGDALYVDNINLSQEVLCLQIPVLEARSVTVFHFGACQNADDCNLFTLAGTQAEAYVLRHAAALVLPQEYDLWDVEYWPSVPYGDGMPDLWQLRIFADAYCNEYHRFHREATSAYEANMAALLAEKPECANPWVAACVSLSTGMRTAICNMFGLNSDLYEVVTNSAKSADEPFSANGDCDGDGISNYDEYLYVSSYGGDIEDFIIAAGENSPFWDGNPALPAAGGIAMALPCLLIALITIKKSRAL